MDQLTPEDRRKLLAHGVGTVIDLRMNWEVAEKPNVFSGSDEVDFLVHDFWGDRFDDYRSPEKAAAPERKLADLYCAGLVKSGFVMAEIMSTFANDSEQGYVFHCRSGKDRTGLVAALLLAIAGVPRETICADFALTSSYLNSEPVNPIDAKAPGAWQRGCAPETMARSLEFLDETYGGVVGYLAEVGITDVQLQTIREKLLR
jgi:protein-tyrosine phosphatase